MYILVKGKLDVTFSDGKVLSHVSPADIVGEMGIFTGERRSAGVVTAENSTVISIHKSELFKLFRKDTKFTICILMNIIKDITKKLKKNNMIIEEMRKSCPPELYKLIISKAKEKS
jgi:CRP-like cAMP-binding protein